MPAPAPRDEPLDALRGLTVLLMVLVNVQGAPDAAYAALRHAEWDGLTLADLVFPAFLFVVGLSVSLALDRPDAPGLGDVARRALLLFAIGVALSWLLRPVPFDQLRWSGVLQRIALVYLACALAARVRPGWALPAGLALLLLAAHAALLHAAPPGGPAGLAPGAGMSGWLDRALLPGRLLRRTWEPEGALSTLSAVATGLLGLAAMRLDRARAPSRAALAAAAGLLALAGAALAPWLPVNKNLWTPSFALLAAGATLAAYAAARAFWPRLPGRPLLLMAGRTALTLYVVHMLLIAVLVRRTAAGTRLWELSFAPLAASGLPPAFASLLYAVLALALSLIATEALRRRGWLIRA